jgi:hypothetical protein
MSANYAISGVWFRENRKGSEHISHVMLHELTSTGLARGTKVTKDYAVGLLHNKTIKTIKWNYRDGTWVWGATVSTEQRNGITYLRTIPDGDVTNNLDNLINMQYLIP